MDGKAYRKEVLRKRKKTGCGSYKTKRKTPKPVTCFLWLLVFSVWSYRTHVLSFFVCGYLHLFPADCIFFSYMLESYLQVKQKQKLKHYYYQQQQQQKKKKRQFLNCAVFLIQCIFFMPIYSAIVSLNNTYTHINCNDPSIESRIYIETSTSISDIGIKAIDRTGYKYCIYNTGTGIR